MLPIASDALVVLQNLFDQDASQTISDASVTGELRDTGGVVLTTFNFKALGSGRYHAIIPADVTANLVDGNNYLIVAVASSGVNQATFHETDVALFQS